MPRLQRVVFSLGANLGDRRAAIKGMIKALTRMSVGPIHLSSLMETAPVDVRDSQPRYLNVLMRAQYRGSAIDLLHNCQSIERSLGRSGKGTKAARTADIDILLLGNEIINNRELTIPHPRIRNRYFCMVGLLEIAPGVMLPGTKKTIRQIFKRLPNAITKQHIRLLD